MAISALRASALTKFAVRRFKLRLLGSANTPPKIEPLPYPSPFFSEGEGAEPSKPVLAAAVQLPFGENRLIRVCDLPPAEFMLSVYSGQGLLGREWIYPIGLPIGLIPVGNAALLLGTSTSFRAVRVGPDFEQVSDNVH